MPPAATHPSLLPTDWKIPAAIRERLGVEAGRQRMMLEEDHLLLVLHASPAENEQGRRGRFFWREPSGVWHAAPRTDRVATLDSHLDEYNETLEQLEQADDAASQAHDFLRLLDRAAPLTRSTRNMHDTLQQAREALPDERRLIVARDRAYDLARRADLLYHDAKNGLEFAMASQAEKQAESSRQMATAAYRLNLLAAFFFPIATLSAIFGTNLQNGMEHWNRSHPLTPLLTVIGAGLFCGWVLMQFIKRPPE